MNSLKIQIKPFCKNNPFHLKDDQIHILPIKMKKK
mgnify:CR=1 FL=1